jgi:hypothetical protein
VSYGRRVDANHAGIRQALRQCGWWVKDMSAMGKGWPDLLAVKAGRAVLVEVKDGSKPPSDRKLTAPQEALHAELKSAGWPVVIVTSVSDAMEL